MPRIRQDVTDISSVDQLLRYATACQLEPLLIQGFTQEKIAVGAGLGATPRSAGPVLATALREGLTTSQLHGLDQIIGALTPGLDGPGSLSSLALRLGAERRGQAKEKRRGKTQVSGLEAHVPPSWTRKILTDPPVSEIGVLMQASALLSEFIAADRMGVPSAVTAIRDRYSGEIDLLVRRLILISIAPPTSRNYDAQVLLGMLTVYAFEPIKDRLHYKLLYSPMGFRVWPAITKLVTLSEGNRQTEALRNWVRQLITRAEDLRENSLYPGNSYDLELALAVPAEWSPPDDDWVGDALRARARNNDATIRERGTAAMGLWQRAVSQERPDLGQTEEDLHDLIAELRRPGSRPDAAGGLRWLAATLEHVIHRQEAVCKDWPDSGEDWVGHVRAAEDELRRFGIPNHLLTGTRNLFRHMILQNAGVYRRWAIETVVTSGMSQPVAQALASLLRAETNEEWLRIRAQAALGFMQRHDASAEADLTRVCLQAYENLSGLADDQVPTRSQISEMHASLFAVGDCFGAAGAEARAKGARELLRPVLKELTDARGDRAQVLRWDARAAAYLLAVTAQPGRNDLSQELLQKLMGHPDPVTRKFSDWVLSFRFTTQWTIRPFIAAAEDGKPDDTPY